MFARGRHEGAPRSGLRWLAGAVGLAVAAGATVIAMAPAQASGATVDAQLSLSGVVTASSPIGGSIVGVHPGDTVKFSASTAPTAGLNALGLGNLVSGLLNALAKFQVTVDFSGLPGGAAATTLSGAQTKSFTFPTAGTYNFTWSAQQISLLGVVPINLNGNELAAAGIKLNAANQYVGSVVVATNPPSGGISIQLPGVTLAPSLPVVGQLPTLAIRAPVLPTLGVPSLPGLPGGSHTPSGPSSSGSTGVNYTPPPTTIPEEVVPKGDGVGGSVSGNQNSSSGFGNSLPDLGGAIGTSGAAPSGGSSSSAEALVAGPRKPGANQAELAANPAPSAQMPVLLAIIAIIALSLVTATYARLYLLRRSPT